MTRIIEILVCIICSALANDQSNIKVETAMIGNNKGNMVQPKPYHIQTLYECDGHAIIYSFPDKLGDFLRFFVINIKYSTYFMYFCV